MERAGKRTLKIFLFILSFCLLAAAFSVASAVLIGALSMQHSWGISELPQLFLIAAGASAGGIILFKLGGIKNKRFYDIIAFVAGVAAFGVLFFFAKDNLDKFRSDFFGSARFAIVIDYPPVHDFLIKSVGDNVSAAFIMLCVGWAVLALGLILGIAGRRTKVPPPPVVVPEPVMHVVTSRETDKIVAETHRQADEAKKKPAERFVKDPWGNLIPESEYNRRHEESMKK